MTKAKPVGDGLAWTPLLSAGGVLRTRETFGPYEFCSIGGQYVIVKDGSTDHPMEAARGRHADVREVWLQLVRHLGGQDPS